MPLYQFLYQSGKPGRMADSEGVRHFLVQVAQSRVGRPSLADGVSRTGHRPKLKRRGGAKRRVVEERRTLPARLVASGVFPRSPMPNEGDSEACRGRWSGSISALHAFLFFSKGSDWRGILVPSVNLSTEKVGSTNRCCLADIRVRTVCRGWNWDFPFLGYRLITSRMPSKSESSRRREIFSPASRSTQDGFG